MNSITVAMCFLFSFFLLGADGADPARDERASLEAERSTLQAKVARLEQEQNFLLFQKVMYSADSKYLLIDVLHHTAQLKYKNRILKDIRFKSSKNFPGQGLRSGMLVLTKKEEGTKGRNSLIFGTSLIVQWKRAVVTQQEAAIPTIILAKKEMQSIYAATEEGAVAYILR
jgi:uncharacterized protein involved in type VI secretion and phage assembly